MSTEPSADALTIPLHAEELQVGKRTVDGDTVVVRTVTRSRDAVVDEMLTDQRVEIERVAVRRIVDEAPDIREEGDTIVVPVLEEVLVTERRLFLKEEVHIRRVRTTTRHSEVVTLREQDAVITRTPPAVFGPAQTKPETELGEERLWQPKQS